MEQKNNSEQNNENLQEQERENIIEMGGITTKNKKGTIYCLNVIGEIEGHQTLSPQSKTTKYEHVLPQLVAVEENDEIQGMLILLNTMGGDVEAGLAIAELISSMSKPVVSLVLGGGHSIGVPLAVSGNYSFIAPSATMIVHPIRIAGVVIGVSQTFHYFQRMQERITNFVVNNSRITEEDYTKLMLSTEEIANDVGSVLFSQRAVDSGLIDEIGGLSQALDKLYDMISKKNQNNSKNT